MSAESSAESTPMLAKLSAEDRRAVLQSTKNIVKELQTIISIGARYESGETIAVIEEELAQFQEFERMIEKFNVGHVGHG